MFFYQKVQTSCCTPCLTKLNNHLCNFKLGNFQKAIRLQIIINRYFIILKYLTWEFKGSLYNKVHNKLLTIIRRNTAAHRRSFYCFVVHQISYYSALKTTHLLPVQTKNIKQFKLPVPHYKSVWHFQMRFPDCPTCEWRYFQPRRLLSSSLSILPSLARLWCSF